MKKGEVKRQLDNTNLLWVSKQDVADLAPRVMDLVVLVADVCDTAVDGEDVWISIGITRKRDALVLSTHVGKTSLSVFAEDLETLLTKVGDLL